MSPGSGFLTGELAESLHGEMVPKFLATVGQDGRPNVVVCTSLDAADPDTLFFGHFLLNKTRENLEREPRVCVAVMTEDLKAWTMKGRFSQWVTDGPLMDRMNEKEFFRYNAYIRISRVGIIEVEEMVGRWSLSAARIATDLLPARAFAALSKGRGQAAIPLRVAEKFARTQALKALAYVGKDGYPRILPAFSMWPTGGSSMFFGTSSMGSAACELRDGMGAAVNVLTMEPVSYQIKGRLSGALPLTMGRIRRLEVDQVYSTCPPLAGEQIEMK